MDITCDQSCDMGYIYLQKHNKNYTDRFDKSRLIAANQPIEVIDNIYLKLNKLNWPDKKYVDALMDGDFIEEFQNDLDENAYMKGIELHLTEERLQNIIENFKIATFEFNGSQYYYLGFDKEEKVFDPQNYVYAFSEKEDALVIISRTNKQRFQITLEKDGSSEKSLSPGIAYVKAIIFNDDSPYNFDYLKKMKLYISADNY